ncbi:MAG: tetratricopeptide repeat protein [Bacteroidales bacterium]|nr:tetratricopeptide repeat protein [Bacteroidales bacterium]
MKEIFKITRGTVVLIAIMITIVLIGLGIAYTYYNGINKSEDPRVINAKIKYEKYIRLSDENNINGALILLDTIESIYSEYDDYKNSYEVGVIYNDRSAIYLTQALYNTQDSLVKDSLLKIAEKYSVKSIDIYKNWIDEFGEMSEESLLTYISPIYLVQNPIFEEKMTDKYIRKRLKEIKIAQRETPRRLSVGYTNLGIIMRHQNDLDSAVKCYILALELWPDNLSAENNLNFLLGKPTRNRNLIDRLFPKEK